MPANKFINRVRIYMMNMPTGFLICEKKSLDVHKDNCLWEIFIPITAGLEMRRDREITNFAIQFEDGTVGECLGSECIDHDVVQKPRKLP